jgi:hypothetical protein
LIACPIVTHSNGTRTSAVSGPKRSSSDPHLASKLRYQARALLAIPLGQASSCQICYQPLDASTITSLCTPRRTGQTPSRHQVVHSPCSVLKSKGHKSPRPLSSHLSRFRPLPCDAGAVLGRRLRVKRPASRTCRACLRVWPAREHTVCHHAYDISACSGTGYRLQR